MFQLEKEEREKFIKWRDEHNLTCVFADANLGGAIGGRFTYSFTPTSIGIVVKVSCACGKEVDLTDYESW